MEETKGHSISYLLLTKTKEELLGQPTNIKINIANRAVRILQVV